MEASSGILETAQGHMRSDPLVVSALGSGLRAVAWTLGGLNTQPERASSSEPARLEVEQPAQRCLPGAVGCWL